MWKLLLCVCLVACGGSAFSSEDVSADLEDADAGVVAAAAGAAGSAAGDTSSSVGGSAVMPPGGQHSGGAASGQAGGGTGGDAAAGAAGAAAAPYEWCGQDWLCMAQPGHCDETYNGTDGSESTDDACYARCRDECPNASYADGRWLVCELAPGVFPGVEGWCSCVCN